MKFALIAAALMLAGPALAQAVDQTQHHADSPGAQTTAEAAGQIKAIDAKAGTVTIHHGPIVAIGWPAMTMTFKATPEALQAAKVGQAVKFTLKTPDNVVIAIQGQ